VTPASLFVAPVLVRLGHKLLTPEVLRWTFLFLGSVVFSFFFFGHTHDLTVPAVAPPQRRALQWLDTHTPQNAIILVDPGRTRYDGYRIYFFTKRRVTEHPASADFHLSSFPYPQTSAWRLSVEFDGIYVYKRGGGDDRRELSPVSENFI
jgi:hypothetical protein